MNARAASQTLTRAEMRILAALADGKWHTEDTLRSTWNFLHEMWRRELIDGAMLGDTFGSSPEERVWRLLP